MSAQQTLPNNGEERGERTAIPVEKAIRHATIAHQGRPDIIRSDAENPSPELLKEVLVSWTSNFLLVVDHSYEWSRSEWEVTEA